jgi:outer membrane protein assembly factor BamB
MLAAVFLGIVFGVMAGGVWADDFQSQRSHQWHQWRGPDATGVAPLGDPPVTWSEQSNVKWKVRIPGFGKSSPIVWKDRVFVLTAVAVPAPQAAQGPPVAAAQSPPALSQRRPIPPPKEQYQFVVLCFDRETGKLLWRRVANELLPHEGFRPGDNSFASGSPITNGRYVYASFGSYGLYCYDMEGQLVWQRDLGDMQTRRGFGEGASPTLHDGTLIVNWDHEGPSFITALDAATGATKWKVDRDEVTTWNTPLVVEHDGRHQVVVNATSRARGYDLDTGATLWECGGQKTNPIASPVTLAGQVYCMTGYRGYALYAIPLSARGDITDTDQIAWQRSAGTPYVSSPLLYDRQLYFTKGRNAILTCVDALSGKPLLDEVRLPGLRTLYASPVAAADRIYFVARDGTTLVIRRGPKLEVLATNRLDDGIDASPAIVGKELFLRGNKYLYCIRDEPVATSVSATSSSSVIVRSKSRRLIVPTR